MIHRLVIGFFCLKKILIIMSRRARRNLLHFKQLSNVIKINQILKKTYSIWLLSCNICIIWFKSQEKVSTHCYSTFYFFSLNTSKQFATQCELYLVVKACCKMNCRAVLIIFWQYSSFWWLLCYNWALKFLSTVSAST